MESSPSTPPVRRLTRVQQLTLNTWRWAALKLDRVLSRPAVLEETALCAVLATLQDVDEPLDLFVRHAQAHPEFALITCLVPSNDSGGLAHEVLDTAFLLRWNELVAHCGAPEELPHRPIHWIADGENRSQSSS